MSWKPFVATLVALWLLAIGLLILRPWETQPAGEEQGDRQAGAWELPAEPRSGQPRGVEVVPQGAPADPPDESARGGSAKDLGAGAGSPGSGRLPVDLGAAAGAQPDLEPQTEAPGSESLVTAAAESRAADEAAGAVAPGAPAEGGTGAGPAPSLDKFRRRLLEQIWEPLGEASERYAKHEKLPKSSWFSEDQESNQASIDELLDQAIGALELSGLNETRGKLRAARETIETLRQENASDREKRLSAQSEAELTRIGKVLELSREDLEERIVERELDIADQEQQIVLLEQTFVAGLRDLGLEVTLESARSLLGTVSGEDFVEMCVAFDNVRLVTEQLETLTREAGESLELARRYYGSYVVLIRILDRIQDDFVRRVREEQLPRLAEFAERARKNIQEAERAARSGGDRTLLEQNMRSNRLTEEACQGYARYLTEQAAAVEAQNKQLDLRLRDAINTFKTVDLSSQVTELLREGERNFRALLELDLPTLEGFQNVELEREYRRLTEQLVEP
jgi:hypothetical protein